MLTHLADLVPWWVYLVLLGGVVLVVAQVLDPRWAVCAAAFAAAALFYRKGRDDGRKVVADQAKDARLDAIAARKESDDAVERMSDAVRDDEWDKWVRDKDSR